MSEEARKAGAAIADMLRRCECNECGYKWQGKTPGGPTGNLKCPDCKSAKSISVKDG